MGTKEIKSDNLRTAKRLLESIGKKFWLSNGTLLGCIRENDFIEHDPDIDVAMWYNDWSDDILPLFLANDFTLYKEYGINHEELQYSFFRGGIKFDIFFLKRLGSEVYQPLFRGDEIIHYVFPKFKLEQCNFNGGLYFIPSNARTMLVTQYGDDWRTPVKEWDCYSSPKNIR